MAVKLSFCRDDPPSRCSTVMITGGGGIAQIESCNRYKVLRLLSAVRPLPQALDWN